MGRGGVVKIFSKTLTYLPYWISDEAVYRTAPAIPGVLKTHEPDKICDCKIREIIWFPIVKTRSCWVALVMMKSKLPNWPVNRVRFALIFGFDKISHHIFWWNFGWMKQWCCWELIYCEFQFYLCSLNCVKVMSV